MRRDASRPARAGLTLPVFMVLAAPFYLNDFANIVIDDWRWWLVIDYVFVKALPLAILGWMLAGGGLRREDLGLHAGDGRTWLVVFSATALVGIVLDQNGYPLIAALPGYAALGGMPSIASATWNWIDLTFGLALVALVEELVFRGVAAHVLERLGLGPSAIVVLSSVIFGLIHWSLGLHAVIVSAAIGAVFMAAYLAARCLPPVVLAHFVVNFIDFAGVVPKSVFRFV